MTILEKRGLTEIPMLQLVFACPALKHKSNQYLEKISSFTSAITYSETSFFIFKSKS